jgi:phosphatidylserine/phosphatidylglycerophosphate/cardiolipin synthase-like enzyme
VRTEKELDQGHGVWFNRGAIASQAFAEKFQNKAPENPDDPADRETKWLSRGLLEACLQFISQTPAGDGLRVAAYEFTYKPVLDALKAALDLGVDVRIVHDDTTQNGRDGANEQAIAAAGLPRTRNGNKVLTARTHAKIPHNKFIVRLAGGTSPTAVWTGSTNFTPSGFLGQTNVGHVVSDPAVAGQYLKYWDVLKKDPERDRARTSAMHLTADPPALVAPGSTSMVFSPRTSSNLLKWYGDRIENAAGSVMFTAAFGVTKALVAPLAGPRDILRFILMEKPLAKELKAEFAKDRHVITCYGMPLGEMYSFKDGQPVARRKIKDFELEKWFLKEDLYRKADDGFVFFVHTKFLLIDPLSNDPLVCSGSANFSPDSLLNNDENMLLIRGNTRVADIYLTEFDRIFRHFYFRDIANELAAAAAGQGAAKSAFLAEDSSWTVPYFKNTSYKSWRRDMFFADPAKTWVTRALAEEGAATPKAAAKKKASGGRVPAGALATGSRKKTVKPRPGK